MANFKFSLAKKTESDGKKQILLRVDLTATIRPSFKTGVYVNPELFTDGKGEIKIPRAKIVKGGAIAVNQVEIDDATRAKTQLNKYTATLNDIILQSKGRIEAKEMKEWIKAVLSLKSLSTISPFTYDNIVEAMEAEKAAEQIAKIDTIYNLIREYCESKHRYGKGFYKNVSESTAFGYRTLARTLARYEYFKQHTGNPDFSLHIPDITHKIVEDFLHFYKTEGDLLKKHPTIFKGIREKFNDNEVLAVKGRRGMRQTNRSTVTVLYIYSLLNSLFDWIIEEKEFIAVNPCKRAMIDTPKEYEKEIHYLTIEQRDRLANADIKGKRRQITRDIFVFACHTGCRISDLMNLTEKNIKNVEDRNTGAIYKVLEYVPIKTSHNRKVKTAAVVLSPKALEIIEKYKGSTTDGKLFPCSTKERYNQLIKEVFVDAGLTDPVEVMNPETGETTTRPLNEIASSHLARKTFTQNLYLTTANVMMVKKAAGHSDTSRVTETTYISDTVGMQAEAIKRMNETATTSNEEMAK